jgi:arabinofuranosyltransferase
MDAAGTVGSRRLLADLRKLLERDVVMARAIVAIAIGVTIGCGVFFWRYTVDDSFITFHYAKNLALGFGPVFNPGEHVEGISNFSWMLVLALVERLGGPMVAASKLLGLAAAVGIIVVLYRSLLRRGCRPMVAALAPLAFVAMPTLHFYSTCGLETLPYAFVVLVATITVAKGLATPRDAIIAALCLIAMPTLRPEGIGSSAVLAGWLLAVERKRLSYVVVAAMGVVLLGGLIARHSYYGQFVPNTFKAKPSPLMFALHAGPGALLPALLRETGQKVTPFLREIGGPLLFGLMGAAAVGRRGRLVLPCMLVFFMGTFFVLYAPVDWMSGHRFGLPYLAPGLFAAALGAEVVIEALGDRAHRLVLGGATLAAASFLTLQFVEVARDIRAYARGDVHKAMTGIGYVRMGEWLRDHSEPHDVVAAYEIGALGYYGERRIVDHVGLVSPYVAKLTASDDGLRFGHDTSSTRELGRYVASQHPRWFFVNPTIAFDASTPPGTPVEPHDLLLADQRIILEELERCAGAKVRLAKVFPMGADPADRTVYLALEVPPVQGGCGAAAATSR